MVEKKQTTQANKSSKGKSLRSTRKINRLWFWGLGCFVLLILIVWLFSDRSATLTGTVLSENEQMSIQQAVIQLDEGQHKSLNELTEAFIFSDVEPGTHTLTVQAEGFETQTLSIELDSGEQWNQDITLKVLPPEIAAPQTLVLVATREPHALELRNTQLEIQKSIPLPGLPDKMVVIKNKAYISLPSLEQIARVDLEDQVLASPIDLPSQSSPAELFPVFSGQNLLIFNKVDQHFIHFNPDTQILSEPIKLPISATQVLDMGQEQFLVLGSAQAVIFSARKDSFSEPFAISSSLGRMGDYDHSSSRFIQPTSRGLLSHHLDSGESTLTELGLSIDRVKQVDDSRWALIAGEKFLVYDSRLKAYTGAYVPLEGKAVDMTPFQQDWLICTRSLPTLLRVSLSPPQVIARVTANGLPTSLAVYQPQ